MAFSDESRPTLRTSSAMTVGWVIPAISASDRCDIFWRFLSSATCRPMESAAGRFLPRRVQPSALRVFVQVVTFPNPRSSFRIAGMEA